MSIRALHYITGDTPQSGFRRIGSSDAFPADQLPLLENGDGLQERSRIESSSSRPNGGGIQQMSHVWEYQTGRYGVPVVINSIAAIGTGRSHAFSEYVLGKTENAAEYADAAALIRGADRLQLLDVNTFMRIPGREEIPCPEDEWEPEEEPDDQDEKPILDEQWRLTLLSRYWHQASVRAFSEDTPETVHVNLGEFSEDPAEETEETIRRAKAFFGDVICSGLPRQVQNIASMSAGTNCIDSLRLYTALEFDITPNMYADETLMVRRPRELKKYRLNTAEREFIEEISSGRIPESIQEFFNRYIQATDNKEATETNTPFMADYRVLYNLYCADRIIQEKHAFIEKAGLMNEHGNPQKIRDARACYLLMRQLRKLLENDHRLNEIRKTLVSELLGPLEASLMQVMLEDMNTDNAEPFMLFRNEKTDFFRKYLYQTPEDQLQIMIDLSVRDQQVSKAPQFVRCYPAVPLRTDSADILNARMMQALLPSVIRPLIDEEKKREKIENKYLDYLRSEEFADHWACLPQNERTRQAFADFFREEIQDPQKHFLLYRISLKYLPGNELLWTTLAHFIRENTKPGNKPNERQLKIAAYGAKEYISGTGRTDPQCVSEMNRYYQACFREYGSNFENIKDIVSMLGGDTTEAMLLIFADKSSGNRITPDEARSVFVTLGGEEGRFARQDRVRDAYTSMVGAQLDQALKDQDRSIVDWISGMISASRGFITFDTTDSLKKIFESAKTGERMKPGDVSTAFEVMGGQAASMDTVVLRAFSEMLSARREEAKEKGELEEFDWQCDMLECCPWKKNPDWLAEQRTDNTIMICESSMKSEKQLDGATLATIQHWLEEDSIQTRGKGKLQQFCNFWLEKGTTTPTEMFLRFFDRIDDQYTCLRDYVFGQVSERFSSGLDHSSMTFGDLIGSCRKDVERSGRRLDDLYRETKEQVDAYLKQHFETNTDLGYLINEQEQIPENTDFYREWQSYLSESIFNQQVDLFARQPNLEKILALRTDILKRSRDMHPALKAAYQLIDGYEERLNRISEWSEYEAVTEMGKELTEMNNQLDRASEVRKTLCTCLRNVNLPIQKKLRGQSFRHALCGSLMQAILTDTGSGSRNGKPGCPDWKAVLSMMFTRAELDDAMKKPYRKDHIHILQRLLALTENVKLMTAYGMNPEWMEELIHTIHTEPALHNYQNALARNRKESEVYQLHFDSDGLDFNN